MSEQSHPPLVGAPTATAVRRRFFFSSTTRAPPVVAINLPAPPLRVSIRASVLASIGVVMVGAVGVGLSNVFGPAEPDVNLPAPPVHGLSYVFGGQPDESAEPARRQQQAFFSPLQLGAFGASSVFVFAVPTGPFSQPRNVLGGHCYGFVAGALVAGTISTGTTLMSCDCCPFLDLVVSALSVGAAVGGMQLLRVMHPPGAVTALAVATAVNSTSSSTSNSSSFNTHGKNDSRGRESRNREKNALITASPYPLLGMAFGVTLGASTLIGAGAVASCVFPLFRTKTTTVPPYKYPAYWV